MGRQIEFDDESLRRVERGLDKLADAVKVTLGPKGRQIVLEKKFAAPTVTNDGMTIAREIELDDPFENIGAQFGISAATRTNDAVGDGTTTATVLVQALVKGGLRNVAAGADPLALGRGISKAADAVSDALLSEALPVTDKNVIANVGTAASRDEEVGQIVAEAMTQVGPDGVVAVEESATTSTELVITNGVGFDKGLISAFFITDYDSQAAVLEDAYVLLYQDSISSLPDLLPVLEKVAASGKPLLIIAEDVKGEALSTLVVNAIRKTLKAVAVMAPYFGDRRKAFLEDLAVVTDGRVVNPDAGPPLAEVGLGVLGTARRIVVTKDTTTIVDGGGTKEAIAQRAAYVRREIATSDSDWDREKLEERLAKLSSGAAVIQVGAASQTALAERMERVADAIAAAHAAVEEGVVAGGGSALVQARGVLDKLRSTLSGDEALGVDLVSDALTAPLYWIATNAGLNARLVVRKVAGLPNRHGLNAATLAYGDLVADGVVDPVKVTRSAVLNAASVTRMVLSAETALVDQTQTVSAQADSRSGRASADPGWSFRGDSGNILQPPPRGPGGGPGEGSEPPSSAPRHLHAEMPERIQTERRLSLIVAITLAPQDGSSVLKYFPVPQGGVTVTIIVSCPGLVPLDDIEQDIYVPATSDSAPHRFTFMAGPVGLHTVTIDAYSGGTHLGAVRLQISILESAATSEPRRRTVPLSSTTMEPGEVTLQVRPGLGGYQFQLIGDTIYKDEPSPMGESRAEISQLVAELNLMAKGKSGYSTPELVREHLKSLGIQLWQAAVPDRVKEQFLEQAEADRIRTVTIVGDHDFVPWELLYPMSRDFNEGFLAEQFPVVRRAYAKHRVTALPIDSAAYIVPDKSLSDAMDEVTAIRTLLGAQVGDRGIISQLSAVRDLVLDPGLPSILHFACHNNFDKGGSSVTLEGGPWKPSDLAEAVARTTLAAGHPLVFFNACRSSGKISWFSQMSGWASSFIEAGAGAFIGSLWAVRSSAAREFAEAFYEHFVDKAQPLGIASLRARQAISGDSGDPTWLAYSIYGNPATVIERQDS
jgi:chaperonin GroEL